MIYVTSKKRKEDQIKKEFPDAFILDVSSSSPQFEGRVLSPFYPHGNIIVPGAEPQGSLRASCVEAVWQGLKVFEDEAEDLNCFCNDTQKNIKRSVRVHGKILGHRWLRTGEILDYFTARKQIYLPCYWWMLKHTQIVQKSLALIKEKSQLGDVVLLDFNVNCVFNDITRPLAHASLVKLFIERNGIFPKDLYDSKPLTQEESLNIRKQERKEREYRKKQIKSKIITAKV